MVDGRHTEDYPATSTLASVPSPPVGVALHTDADTAKLLGHADYWLFLAGFALLWLAWVGLRARRAEVAGAPWMWLVWSAALAGAWMWQQLLAACFGDTSTSRILGAIALAAVPVLYLEFARRSARLTGPLGALMKHAWPIAAGISVTAAFAPDALTTAMTTRTLGAACGLLGLVAAKCLAGTGPGEGRALGLSVAGTALLTAFIVIAGGLPSVSSYPDSLIPGVSAPAFTIIALLAGASAWWLIAGLARRSEMRHGWGVPVVIAVILLLGWVAAVQVGNAWDQAFRSDMKSRVLSAASGLDPTVVAALAGDRSDTKSPAYRRLKRVLIELLTADNTTAYAYVMALRKGQVVFLADAEPDASPEVSLPGDVYESTTPGMLNSLNTGEPLVEGPAADAWGTWISAFAAIRAPEGHRPLAVLGLDVDAHLWKSKLSTARLGAIAIVSLLCVAAAAVGAAQRHSVDQALAESRRQYENLVRGSPNMVALLDAQGHLISLNETGCRYLGLEGASAGRRFEDVWPTETRDKVSEALAAASKGESVRYEVHVPGPEGPRSLSLAVRPIRDPAGIPEGFICTGSDVTALIRARMEIQAQAAFLQGLLNTMPHFIAAKGLDGRFTCCNLAAARFLGLDPEDLHGKTAHEILPEEVADELTNSEEQLLATGGRAVHEIRVSGPDGQPRDILYTKGLYYDQDGKPAGFVGVGLDITERKQTDRLLKDSEERMRAIAAAAMDAVIMMDERGNISFWNAAAAAMFGYSEEEALGKPVHDLIAPPRLRPVAADGLEHFRKSGRGPAVGKVTELTAQRKSGEEFCVELSVAPVQIGQTWHAVGILRDITERKAAEEQRRLLAEVIEQSDEGVLIADPSGRPVYANLSFERFAGVPSSELASLTSDSQLFERLAVGPAIRRVREGLGSWCDTVSATGASGPCRIEVRAFPVYRTSGELGAIVVRTRDVGREETLEAQLRLSQKMTAVGQLAAGIAHEINTPLQYVADNTRFLQSSFSSILGLIESFRQLAGSPDLRALKDCEAGALLEQIERVDLPFLAQEIPQAVQEALEGLDRAATIVRAMKEFSHPGGSEKRPTDINAAVTTTLTVSRNAWKYVAEIEPILEPDLPMVECLPGDINQVLLNLLVNAAQAIEERVGGGSDTKGKIVVRTWSDGECVMVSVTDDGAGIPEEARDRIFEPFFTTKEVGKGTGQGLWIAHSLIEKHGGSLTFESEVGKGTTFTVTLPISPCEARNQEVA